MHDPCKDLFLIPLVWVGGISKTCTAKLAQAVASKCLTETVSPFLLWAGFMLQFSNQSNACCACLREIVFGGGEVGGRVDNASQSGQSGGGANPHDRQFHGEAEAVPRQMS